MTAAGTKPEAADPQPEAAVAATDKVAGEAEEMPPRHTMCLRGKAAAEVTPLPNEELATVPNGAIQGPPSRTHLEERGRRDGRVTGVREDGGKDNNRSRGCDPLPRNPHYPSPCAGLPQ